jgi:beta-carotene 3-hydroxylase
VHLSATSNGAAVSIKVPASNVVDRTVQGSYDRLMFLRTIALFLVTFFLMEAVAYFAHKYLFHGPLWFLHKSHHEPRKPGLEWNDLFGPFFAVIAIVLIGGYAAPQYLDITRPIGAGMTLYGAVYFFIHDMYTHRRFWKIDLPGKWLASMRTAHRYHHSNIKKIGQEPFGFVFYQTYEPKRKAGVR